MVGGSREGVNLEGLSKSTIDPGAVIDWLRARSPRLPWWTRLGYALAPPRCVLCGGEGDLGALDLCAACLGTLPFIDRDAGAASFSPFEYRDPVGSGLRALKFHGDQRPARVFGALLAATVALRPRAAGGEVAALVPVPLHAARYAERGFNQAESIARHAGLWLGLPVQAQGLSRVRATRPQTGLRGAERRRNLAAAFTAASAVPVVPAARAPQMTVRGVALIDDVLTTGATVAAARTALLAAGVPSVQVWTVARAPLRRDAEGAAAQAARSA